MNENPNPINEQQVQIFLNQNAAVCKINNIIPLILKNLKDLKEELN